MWGKRYFSPRYWAERFFPPTGTAGADVYLHGESHGTSSASSRRGLGPVVPDIAPVVITAIITPESPPDVSIVPANPTVEIASHRVVANIAADLVDARITPLAVEATMVRIDSELVEPPTIVLVTKEVPVRAMIAPVAPTVVVSSEPVEAVIVRVEEPQFSLVAS